MPSYVPPCSWRMSMMLHSTSSAPALAFAASIMAGLMSLACIWYPFCASAMVISPLPQATSITSLPLTWRWISSTQAAVASSSLTSAS